jgi:Tol biopolymer transport system component
MHFRILFKSRGLDRLRSDDSSRVSDEGRPRVRRSLTSSLVAVVALAGVIGSASAAHAQGYFGQNKVQYKTFKFQVLETEHFDIYFYPEEEAAARMASRMAERWYARLSLVLNHDLRGRQPLVLYASGPDFRQTNVVEGDLGEGTGGVTEAYKRRIVLPFAGPIESTDHVLGHELVHAFQYDITNTNASSGGGGAMAMPLWFIEGMAEYLSIGPVDPNTAMWMREAARREKLPDVDQLDNPRYFPYRYGQALWAYIGGKYGDRVVGQMLRAAVGRSGTYQDIIKGILGIDTKTLSTEWHDAEFKAYRPVAEATQMPADFARPVIVAHEKGVRLNVSPEISPDGSRFMYFSERNRFSIDLYLAETSTGKVIRKITDTATDAHFESLQFLTSAGSWSADGKQFVFPGISKGEPVLEIVDVDRGRIEREIRLPKIDEVINPAWSPDGKAIAFSGLVGGFNDLFVYDLDGGGIRRLTTDPYAELDPAWSPDGKQLAFSTDRYTTDVDRLRAGPLRLAILDLATEAVTEAGGFPGAKNISPQWTADGRALFFVSDHQGIANLYRVDLIRKETTQITNLLTGASGITSLSPAMSASNGRIIFSAYENDGYSIYALETPEQLAGRAPVELPVNAAVLPPRRTGQGPVWASIHDLGTGLPKVADLPAAPEPYKPKLSLDFAGQPTVGVGADPFGAYAVGGMSFIFSDILGNHTLGVGAQVTSRFDEFGGQLFYLNRTHRWNWGLDIEQVPYVARAFDAGIATIPGQPATYVENEYRILQRDQAMLGVLSYPLSRATRVEVTGGFRRIGLKEDVTTRQFDLNTGQQLSEDRTTLASEPTLNLGQASSALVYDTSIFGATSPIRGSRYRLELSQTAGSITYTGLLTDVRTYVMPFRPYTFAFRGLYFGRYGQDSGDGRLPTLYLGYPGLVRGYDSGSFQSGECGVTIDGSCPAFDRLIGSRVGVANAEVRFPLWGIFKRDEFYGPLPVELAVFADGGVAWGSNTQRFVRGADSKPIGSVGGAARINVFGFAVAEIDYVRPLNRPGRGWLWQFNLIPGF